MNGYIDYMRNQKRKAKNTLLAYERDLSSFEQFLVKRSGGDLGSCTESDAVSYILELNNQKKSKSTVNRKVSALRSYYEYCILIGMREDNPFSKIKSVKAGKRKIDYLTISETEELLDLPDDSIKGIRDRALLEFMYGTGARVTEVVRLRFEDMNIRMGFVTLRNADDESRIVPLGRYARNALEDYIRNSYGHLAGRAQKGDDIVFVNMKGEPLSRQGIWKILKDYGALIGKESRMTPAILRDSFAVHILQNGGDLKTLQELMGFEDMSIGIAYMSLIDIHVKEVFNHTHPRA